VAKIFLDGSQVFRKYMHLWVSNKWLRRMSWVVHEDHMGKIACT